MKLCFFTLICMLLVKGILCSECGHTKAVNGIKGEDAILQLDQKIVDVAWYFRNSLVAITFTDKRIDIRDDHLERRLYSMADASLRINHLTERDQGIYTASVRSKNRICTQRYDLKTYKKISREDIKIHQKVIKNETCHVMLTCTVNGRDVTVTWTDSRTQNINGTDNCLHIANVTEDVNYTCTAENMISKASRSVSPFISCKQDMIGKDGQKMLMEASRCTQGACVSFSKNIGWEHRQEKGHIDYTGQNIVRLVLAACVLILLLCICYHHVKRESVRHVGDSG
ncbi:SLAM family member 6-like [Discoglossus pictus]